MSAPVDLEHVPQAPWLGEAITGVHADTGEADGVAAGSDVGGLGSDLGGMGDGGNYTFNLSGAFGTATSQYHQSFMDSQTRWGEAMLALEVLAAVVVDMQLGQVSAWLPVLDKFAVKPLARRAGFDLGIADTLLGGIRAVPVIVIRGATGRHQELARLRARAEMREMGSVAKGAVDLAKWMHGLLRGKN